MSRARGILALLAVLAAAVFVPASAVAYGDVKGPPCADYIVGEIGGFAYVLDDQTGRGIASGRNQLSKPACSSVTYEAIIQIDGSPTLTIPGTPNVSVEGLPVVEFSADLGTDPPTSICYYLTSTRQGKVLDRGPDMGCELLLIGPANAKRGQG